MRLSGWKPASGGDRNMQNLRDLHNQNKLHITLIIHFILLLFQIHDGSFQLKPGTCSHIESDNLYSHPKYLPMSTYNEWASAMQNRKWQINMPTSIKFQIAYHIF